MDLASGNGKDAGTRTGTRTDTSLLCAPQLRPHVDGVYKMKLGHNRGQVVSCWDSRMGSQAARTHSTALRNKSCSMFMAMALAIWRDGVAAIHSKHTHSIHRRPHQAGAP